MVERLVVVASPSSGIDTFLTFLNNKVLQSAISPKIITSSDFDAISLALRVAAMINCTQIILDYNWDSIHDTSRSAALIPTPLSPPTTEVETLETYHSRLTEASTAFPSPLGFVFVSKSVLESLCELRSLDESSQVIEMTKQLRFMPCKYAVVYTNSDVQFYARSQSIAIPQGKALPSAQQDTLRDLRLSLTQSISQLFHSFRTTVGTELTKGLATQLEAQASKAVQDACADIEQWAAGELANLRDTTLAAFNAKTRELEACQAVWQARLQSISTQQAAIAKSLQALLQSLSVEKPNLKFSRRLEDYEAVNEAMTAQIAELNDSFRSHPPSKRAVISWLQVSAIDASLSLTVSNRKIYSIENAELTLCNANPPQTLMQGVQLCAGENIIRVDAVKALRGSVTMVWRLNGKEISEVHSLVLSRSSVDTWASRRPAG